MDLYTQSSLVILQSNGVVQYLYYPCFFKCFLSGKVIQGEHEHHPWSTGVLAITMSLVISIHLCGLSLHRARLDVLPEGLETLSEMLLLSLG